MTRLLEQLHLPSGTPRQLEHWAGIDLYAVAESIHDVLFDGGVCLPLTWMEGTVVAPVVDWDQASLAHRLAEGSGPVLDRALLRDMAYDPPTWASPVLTMTGFTTFGPMRRAGGALALLSGMARVVAAVPAPPGAMFWDAMECDIHGFSVVEASTAGTRVLFEGHPGPAPGSLPVLHQQWLMQEQLFDVAQRFGAVPQL